MLHTIIFIGRSGCGKGTQAELLKQYILDADPEKRQLLYIETGENFRKFIRGETYTSKLSQKMYANDERQPDFLACLMWGNVLVEEFDENMHLFFDGTPRSKNEALLLSNAIKFYKREKPVVIYIDISRKVSEERLLARGRFDDQSLAKIDKRLDWFDKDVLPTVEYFRGDPMYKFIEVDGEQSISDVHQDIIAAYTKEDDKA